MTTIAFIPVRGGSKSIPRKNILDFNGRPLLFWTALAAEQTPEIERLVIATEDPEIVQIAIGFQFSKLEIYHRSEINAADTASTESVMLEYLKSSNIDPSDRFILIQATNPFLTHQDLSMGIEKMNAMPQGSVISCATFKRFLWNRNGQALNYDYQNRPRRQDFEGTLIENGAFYINTVGNILSGKNRLTEPVQVTEMREFTYVEIDEPEDWMICEKIHSKYILNQN